MTAIAPTLSKRFIPSTLEKIRGLYISIWGSLLIAALTQIEVVLPFIPVPNTGQTFGVLLIGTARLR